MFLTGVNTSCFGVVVTKLVLHFFVYFIYVFSMCCDIRFAHGFVCLYIYGDHLIINNKNELTSSIFIMFVLKVVFVEYLAI